jgi:hypothetical protein
MLNRRVLLFNEAAEYDVLTKMLLNRVDTWRNHTDVCFSILGTRLQMGQPSVKVSTELVANGYAVLSHYVIPKGRDETGMACICFPTDPVCARLAMAMMDQHWTVTGNNTKTTVRGKEKRFWTNKMTELLSTGFCRPSRGGLVELAAASYLLFCGDVLRKRIDQNYKTFSVPLLNFVECLLKPNDFYEQNEKLEEKAPHLPDGCQFTEARVSFIQVTRNYIRFSVEHFFHQAFLRGLYQSGTVFYVYPLFPVFDFVASIKLSNSNGEEHYVPMLVSIATDMAIGTQNDWLELMQNAVNGYKGTEEATQKGAQLYAGKEEEDEKYKDNEYVHKRGKGDVESKKAIFGLRLAFDRLERGNKGSAHLLTVDDVVRLLHGEAVAKVLIVSKDDPFGIMDMLVDATLCGSEASEVYAAHSFVYNHAVEDIPSEDLVRTSEKRPNI